MLHVEISFFIAGVYLERQLLWYFAIFKALIDIAGFNIVRFFEKKIFIPIEYREGPEKEIEKGKNKCYKQKWKKTFDFALASLVLLVVPLQLCRQSSSVR